MSRHMAVHVYPIADEGEPFWIESLIVAIAEPPQDAASVIRDAETGLLLATADATTVCWRLSSAGRGRVQREAHSDVVRELRS